MSRYTFSYFFVFCGTRNGGTFRLGLRCFVVPSPGIWVFLGIGAFFLAEVAAQRFRRSHWILTAALPVFAWYAHVRVMRSGLSPGKLTLEVVTWTFARSVYGILLRMRGRPQYDLPGFKRMLALM